jgi:hypothetical protein
LVRMPHRRKPDDVHWRNCRVGRRSVGSDQALMGAGSWARHSIKNDQSWPNGSRSTELIWESKAAISSRWLNLSLGSASQSSCHIDRVARIGDVWAYRLEATSQRRCGSSSRRDRFCAGAIDEAPAAAALAILRLRWPYRNNSRFDWLGVCWLGD